MSDHSERLTAEEADRVEWLRREDQAHEAPPTEGGCCEMCGRPCDKTYVEGCLVCRTCVCGERIEEWIPGDER